MFCAKSQKFFVLYIFYSFVFWDFWTFGVICDFLTFWHVARKVTVWLFDVLREKLLLTFWPKSFCLTFWRFARAARSYFLTFRLKSNFLTFWIFVRKVTFWLFVGKIVFLTFWIAFRKVTFDFLREMYFFEFLTFCAKSPYSQSKVFLRRERRLAICDLWAYGWGNPCNIAKVTVPVDGPSLLEGPNILPQPQRLH